MKFHTQLKAKDIFKFSLAYTYSGLQAIMTIFLLVIGGYLIVQGITQPQAQTNMVFGIILIVLFVVVNPLMLYVKAKKQAIENPAYKVPTYYTLQEDGIFVELGEESATIEWIRVYKITQFMGLTILYTGKKQAFVFPDYELGADKEEMLSYMKEHIEKARTMADQTGKKDISKYSKVSANEEEDTEEVKGEE